MMPLYRARLSLLAAVGLASALVVLEFPVNELFHQQRELASVSSQLASVEARNATLTGDISTLRQPQTIASIADGEYGLIGAGQVAYALLPSSNSAAAASGTLGETTLPPSDLVVPAATPVGITTPEKAPADRTGIWGRMLDRLEFWRWAL